ncbi:deoxyribodipyrimidine photo-lyase [Bacillus lacus]|uniref:Deoxyribodipyrimidine photo-lyase n=1 Tax=Metabacillus lacus TaxID=1983721 RepID=A0A7X2LWP0_9BACI|nr:deoxyribodipyrimidine photo-lyase [Metabacillus lacus]MRX71690.1 deoxyribodipyrimidine photo-lyase [Metabacillus lacus]
MKQAIVWFRRDFRLQDNLALFHAVEFARKQDAKLIFVFQIDPYFNRGKIELGNQYFFQAVHAFMKGCRSLGISFIIKKGDPVSSFQELFDDYPDITAMFLNEDRIGYGLQRDEKVKEAAEKYGISWYSYQDAHILGPGEVLKGSGTYYEIFSPYYRRWETLPKQPPVKLDLSLLKESAATYDLHQQDPILKVYHSEWRTGEKAAWEQMKNFTDKILYSYHDTRNKVHNESTSKLSPFIKTGAISARTLYFYVRGTELNQDGKNAFLKELAWRDFFQSIFARYPESRIKPVNSKYNAVPWRENREYLKLWQEGRTGYPLIDAAMRQLNQEGWIHNRLRMITASFLTKNFLIDWRHGEHYFSKKLIDYDLASNAGGWQWAASVGTDAVPYYRIFNPVTQSKQLDPDGSYIKTYIPELRNVPITYIHEPWKMDEGDREAYGCPSGREYPKPAVNHHEQRKLAIEMFQTAEGENKGG